MNKINLFNYRIISINTNKATKLVYNKIERNVRLLFVSINLRAKVGVLSWMYRI